MRYSVNGTAHEARAARDVVVSAGSVNSPQLLELSGIGQPERLKALGIEVKHALPGVGENLRDHYAPRTRWLVGAKGVTIAVERREAVSRREHLVEGGGRRSPRCPRSRRRRSCRRP